MSAAPVVLVDDSAPVVLVDDSAFNAACTSARAVRAHRFTLWHYIQPTDLPGEDVPWRWHRVGSAATRAHHNRTIGKVERWGDRYAWLITEEHHNVIGDIFTPDGTPLEKNWQPYGPGLLRTAANPHVWIPFQRLIAWNFCSAIAITDAPVPDDFTQPRRALYAPENDVFVHFTQTDGPYEGRNGGHASADNKYLAPRHISERMSAFLGGRPTASLSEIITAVVRYIQRNRLMSTLGQTVTPDATVASLLDSHPGPFPLHELTRRLRHHAGDLVRPEEE
jgi:hypothetical protein